MPPSSTARCGTTTACTSRSPRGTPGCMWSSSTSTLAPRLVPTAPPWRTLALVRNQPWLRMHRLHSGSSGASDSAHH
eukprot:419296-Heterocapsa_arctica.AAC.1